VHFIGLYYAVRQVLVYTASTLQRNKLQ